MPRGFCFFSLDGVGLDPSLQVQSRSVAFGQGPPLQGDFVRRVVPRPAPTRGRGTSMYRSDEIPLQRRPSRRGVFRFGGHCLRPVGAGIDEATDIQLAKDAVVRGSGASRPWMACARLLEPWTAQSGDAHDPRTTAAPSRRRQIPVLWLKPEARTAAAPPEGDKSRCFGSTQKPAPPRLPSKPTDSSALRPRPENQPIMAAGPLPPESPP